MPMFKWLKKLWDETASEPAKPKEPSEPEKWTITLYRIYNDVSYGLKTPSISYEAISNKGRRVSKSIYHSAMSQEQLLWMLNNGQKPGRDY